MPQIPLDQSDAQLVAEACSRAAQVLGLSSKELSEVLSTHQPNADGKDLDPQTREGQLALLFLRVYRSLHGLCGGDQSLMRHWIEQPNRHLGEQSPRLLLARLDGLNCVADYLDSFCH
ncbi:MAG: MbcA/ParS/Xre antitoxin family protein [Synechococcus sp.]